MKINSIDKFKRIVIENGYELDNVDNIVFFPKGSISEGQRRQMTTLQKNIHAFEVNGDFDVCQALAKTILGDKEFAQEVFNDKERFTSANSISLGRLLPQAVYPFYAYSKVGKEFIASMNSYLGIMSHYKSYKLRKRMIFKNLSAWWWNYVYLSGGIKKFDLKLKPAK
jgi:hypothetical protein